MKGLRLAWVPVLAAVWALAAYLLWQSKVPSLHLPHLDEHAYFARPQRHAAIVIGLARFAPRRWWIAAAQVFVGLTLLFRVRQPYLVGANRLQDPPLRAIATRLERAEGVGRVPVDVQTMHDTTSLPNAEVMGIGPSRRIVLWDTIVDGRFGTRELAFVLAHEVGHLARNHIWKDVGWYALFAFPGTFLLALPLQNAISRHMEAEADWMALRTTHDPAAAVALFRRFQSTTLEEPSPPTWDYLLLENHPTLMQRIEMARAYATLAAQSP